MLVSLHAHARGATIAFLSNDWPPDAAVLRHGIEMGVEELAELSTDGCELAAHLAEAVGWAVSAQRPSLNHRRRDPVCRLIAVLSERLAELYPVLGQDRFGAFTCRLIGASLGVWQTVRADHDSTDDHQMVG
jgi:hypothetical protein